MPESLGKNLSFCGTERSIPTDFLEFKFLHVVVHFVKRT